MKKLLFLLIVFMYCIPINVNAEIDKDARIISVDPGYSNYWVGYMPILAQYPVRWPSYTSIDWYFNLGGLIKANPNDNDSVFETAIYDAFLRWQNTSEVAITFDPKDDTATTTWTGDDQNTVIFTDEEYAFLSGPATTFLTWDPDDDGKMYECDIFIRNKVDEYEWTCSTGQMDGNTDVFYLPRVLTHEIGHMIGLGHHTSVIGSIMDVVVDSEDITITNNDKGLGAFLTTGHIIDDIEVSMTSGQTEYIRNDLTIDSNKTLTLTTTAGTGTNRVLIDSGKKITINGTLEILKDFTFSKASTASSWGGITINSGGVLDNNESGTVHKVTITDATSGIKVNNATPLIKKVEVSDCTNGIEVVGTDADPLIQWVTLSNNTHGINVNETSADAVVDYCSITDNSTDGVYVSSGGYICLTGPSLYGNNTIVKGIGNYAVDNDGAGSVYAEYNYWGSSSPTSALFSGSVDWNPYLTTATSGVGAGKIASQAGNPLTYAMNMELTDNYEEALIGYRTVLADEKDVKRRKFILTSMLRVIDKYDRNYDDFRVVLLNELEVSNYGWYQACVDYLLTSLLIREGKYGMVIEELLEKSADYQETTMEVEMLSRAASIKGLYLNSKDDALILAERAAAVNPGSCVVKMAYEAAGIVYDNTQYENLFVSINDGFDNKEQLKKTVNLYNEETATPTIVISPNPANPATTLHYTLTQPGNVKINIYSVSGQKVATLVDEFMTSGKHAVVFDGSNLASGVYFYQFQTEGFAKSGKMLLVK